MNEPLKSDEKDLYDLIVDLFNIACIEIPKFYITKKLNKLASSTVNDFEKNKDTIIKSIIEEIMRDESGKKVTAITPETFLKRFTNYRLVRLI